MRHLHPNLILCRVRDTRALIIHNQEASPHGLQLSNDTLNNFRLSVFAAIQIMLAESGYGVAKGYIPGMLTKGGTPTKDDVDLLAIGLETRSNGTRHGGPKLFGRRRGFEVCLARPAGRGLGCRWPMLVH